MEIGFSAHEATISGKSTSTFGSHLIGFSNYKVLRSFVNISLMLNTDTDEFYKYAAKMFGGLAVPVINTSKIIIAPEFAPSYVVIIDERNQEKPQLVWGIGLNAGIKIETNFLIFFSNIGIHKGDVSNSLGLGLVFQ